MLDIVNNILMNYTVENRKVLFVEDDIELLTKMKKFFVEKGNNVLVANSISKAKEVMLNNTFDIIVLDIILPDGEGLEIFKFLDNSIPVIILSDISSEEMIISSYSLGAIDYIVKPCSMELLEIHIALRLTPKSQSIISLFGLTLDFRLRTLVFNEKNIILTASEFNILYFLMKNAGKFFRSEEIYENVWKAPSLQTTTIKRHLSTLRCKLKESTNKNFIITEFGKGYSFLSEN